LKLLDDFCFHADLVFENQRRFKPNELDTHHSSAHADLAYENKPNLNKPNLIENRMRFKALDVDIFRLPKVVSFVIA
jgi:hypothetical protein